MAMINVLVVDDSAFMRKMIAEILQSHPRINVIGVARNGIDALDKIDQLNPDVITLDVEMPIMDGITTLKEIMTNSPRPVIMLSSLTKEGANKTFESMELGAIDFITKPSGSISLNIKEKEAEIKTKVLQAVNAKVEKISKLEPKRPIITPFASQATKNKARQDLIIGIGTSTGGPRALQQVITQLPKDIPAPIAIVQHMPAGFTKSLAKRLDSMSKITVKEVEDQELLQKGTAYIAPGGFQLRVKKTVKGLQAIVKKEDARNGHQPSVEVLFESLTQLKHEQVYAIIMTGMGSDGADSLITLKEAKPNTIIFSESKETCIVYGMPQAAEKTKLVDHVVRLPEMSEVLVSQIKARGE